MDNKKIIILIIFFSMIFIIGAVFITYNLTKVQYEAEAKINSNQNMEESEWNNLDENIIGNYLVTTSSSDEIKVSPNADITFNIYYKKCGHTVKNKEKVKSNIVNLTKKEIEKEYAGWKVNFFSNNNVELYKEDEYECGEHFLAIEENGKISVYKTSMDGEKEIINNTAIETQYLPGIDRESLKKGVEIIGEENLNIFIENFE